CDAHEPRSERLSGEPLLQPIGYYAGRLIGSGMRPTLAILPSRSAVSAGRRYLPFFERLKNPPEDQ
ncbi:hypothetical protein ACC676_39555, partial [Rhizobium ruizarguesonis]